MPDPSHALDTVLFALLYLVWPIVFAVGMFLFVLKISFGPPDDQDVERSAPETFPNIASSCCSCSYNPVSSNYFAAFFVLQE